MNSYRRLMLKVTALSAFMPIKSFAEKRLLKRPFFIEIEVSKNFDPAFRSGESSSFDVNEFNDRYIREGKILSIKPVQKTDSVIYQYTFANYEIYREWNDRVYHQNAPLKKTLAQNGTKFKRFF